MNFPIYTPAVLLGVYTETSDLPMFWRNLCFNSSPIYSDDEEIQFNKIHSLRHVAPFVHPLGEGTPTYNARETVTAIKPAYIKLEDVVTPNDFTGRRAVGVGELGIAGQIKPLTPQQRYLARITELLKLQDKAIKNRLELMCFEAISSGVVEVRDDKTNTVDVVNFGRDPSHDIVLLAGTRWDDPNVNPLDDISDWKRLASNPKGPNTSQRFGTAPNVWVMGLNAAHAFRNNPNVQKELDKNYVRPDQTTLQTGALKGDNIEYIGKLNNGDEIWQYSEYYDLEDGTQVQILDPDLVIGVAPNSVNGQIAYGTIQNLKADLATLPVFPSMYEKQDGSAAFVKSESSPMVFPVNPNATMRIRVLG